MSHYMTALAMKQKGLKPATKIVLYWLADHHNGETGACFPSLKTLERECEMNRSTIVRHLEALEADGLIERERRERQNGSQTSTSYILHFTPVAERNSPCCKTQQPPVAKCDPLNLGINNLGTEQESIDHFEDFWSAYPRKIGKGNARRAFAKAMKNATIEEISSGLNRQLAALSSKEQQYIPHASTWLNGERWNDEPDQSTSKPRNSSADTTAREIAFAARAGRTPSLDSF